MAQVIDYPLVLREMQAVGMRCLYHNSGAFGFEPAASTFVAGWVRARRRNDSAGRAADVRQVPPPYPPELARLAVRAWREVFAGRAWLMPKSHWAYELEFGSHAWLPDCLRGRDRPEFACGLEQCRRDRI